MHSKINEHLIADLFLAWGGQTKIIKEVVVMELVPWRPFGELSPFRREMD